MNPNPDEKMQEMLAKFIEDNKIDLLDYTKCRALEESLLKEKQFILSQINLENKESQIKQTLVAIDTNISEINKIVAESEEVINKVDIELDAVEEVRKNVHCYLDKIHTCQSTLQYVRVVQRIEILSNDLEKEFANKDDEKCATIFANLCEISRNLIDSMAIHLKSYLKETILYWHNILKEKLSHDFDEVLKTIKWPFVNANFSLATPTHANIQKLQIITEYLLEIELPDECTSPLVTSALLANFPRLCLPMHFLVLPLKKRFLYHFYGGRQTNRIDKPEWYFTQILSWIRDHSDFITKWIQPIIDKLGLHHIDAKLELMRGLVQVAAEKLYSDLPNLQYDDFTFSHSVDEALGFDKELRETYHYPSSQPSILAVLTQAPVFNKWMSMEKKYAIEKMDTMLSTNNAIDAFEPINANPTQPNSTLIEHQMTSSCADMFITLLQTITERYEALPQPGHRLQFLDLQLNLLDDFRVRLLQLVKAQTNLDMLESRTPMILNTLYYIENVLIDWGSMLHYLHLHYYKKQQLEYIDSIEANPLGGAFELDAESVFADTLALYRHKRKDLLSTLSESVVRECKIKSNGYKRERWSAVIAHKDMRSLSLTPTACAIFEILARRLHQLQKNLATDLFTIVWRFIAQALDDYLYEELVLENRFNEGGALQFKYDITRNLFPLFAQFSENPQHNFIKLKETCDLLNISKGSALLLRETLVALEGATGVEDRRGQALKEVGVVHFRPKDAITILNQRTDITIHRMSNNSSFD